MILIHHFWTKITHPVTKNKAAVTPDVQSYKYLSSGFDHQLKFNVTMRSITKRGQHTADLFLDLDVLPTEQHTDLDELLKSSPEYKTVSLAYSELFLLFLLCNKRLIPHKIIHQDQNSFCFRLQTCLFLL